MKKVFFSLAVVAILVLLWKLVSRWMADKSVATERGQDRAVNGLASLIWNLRAPVVTQGGVKPLTTASVNPVTGTGNPVYNQTARQTNTRLAGSWSGSDPVDPGNIVAHIVPPETGIAAWSQGIFGLN